MSSRQVHAGENVSRKSRKSAQLKAFCFTDYQLSTKLISIMDNIQHYFNTWRHFTCRPALACNPRTCLANIFGPGPNNKWDTLMWKLNVLICSVNFLVCTRKPWLTAISHPKPSTVLLSRLASRKDCKPAVGDSKPRLWSLGVHYVHY